MATLTPPTPPDVPHPSTFSPVLLPTRGVFAGVRLPRGTVPSRPLSEQTARRLSKKQIERIPKMPFQQATAERASGKCGKGEEE
eukprot:CAMPEP_0206221970 /NCGR_PEP_ID=MMETSP0047_2-20121206/5709_1 /ASSEMBLY_ACC=CAM_ASM_000192 /TAXON_ID=195065 /ORGANISM="Chroomonas mesostigmatica_cf, Strain CCMP1168" /LENGTH=83 /DNA_ID=CAMNT_0053644761 /DNA_START=266 /DNA_END=514 /DNA_ORIENTATION=-